jgi:hypothetical protein
MSSKFYFITCVLLVLSACKEQKEAVVYSSTEILQLAVPQVQVDSLLFNKKAEVTAVFDMDGVDIRYTSDGAEVTNTSMLYDKKLAVTESSEFTFRAFHTDYLPSKPISTRLLKVKKDVSTASVTLTPQPDKNYSGGGAKVLVDLQKGTTQFRAGDHWLGLQGKQIKIALEFEQETTISKLIISSLNDHGSWIFLPKGIRVFTNDKQELGMAAIPIPTEMEPKTIALLDVPIVPGTYKNIEIYIDLLETIPQWHQGTGTPPFFFIDEILVE